MAKPVFSSTVLGLTMALTAPTTALIPPSLALENQVDQQDGGLLVDPSKLPNSFSEAPEDPITPEEGTEEGTPKAEVPGKPTGLFATAIRNSVFLAWDKAFTNSHITGYEYRQKEISKSYGAWNSMNDSLGSSTSYTVMNLGYGITYEFQIRAVSYDLKGTPSTAVSITMPGQPPAPKDLEVHPYISDDGHHYWPYLLWKLVDSNSHVSGYELRVLKENRVFRDWEQLTVLKLLPGKGFVNMLTDYLLLPNQDYTFQLRAVTSTAKGLISEVNVNYPPQQPFAPYPVTAAIIDGDVKLSWSDYTNGVAPYKYEYRMKKAGGNFGSWIIIKDSFHDGSTAHVLTYSTMIGNLEPGTNYTFEVRASLDDLFHAGYPNSPFASITIPGSP